MIENYIRGKFKREMQSRNKEDALKEVFETTDQPPDILVKIKKREEQFPTGLGRGIAIPRYIVKEVKEIVLALGIYRDGLDFGALDYKPVKIIWMLLCPEGEREKYISILAHIIRLAMREEFRSGVLNLKSYEDIVELIKEIDR